MDLGVDVFFNALFYVICGAFIGALVGWSLTYLRYHPEPTQQAHPPLRKHERDAARVLRDLEKKGMKL